MVVVVAAVVEVVEEVEVEMEVVVAVVAAFVEVVVPGVVEVVVAPVEVVIVVAAAIYAQSLNGFQLIVPQQTSTVGYGASQVSLFLQQGASPRQSATHLYFFCCCRAIR